MRAAVPALVLSLAASLSPCARADVHLVPDPDGPLAGKTIVVSPGHGFMPENGAYRWQRGVTHGLREDVHTNEIVIEHLQRLLANAGARVESVRERSFQTREVIVDDGAAGYRETGTWTTSTASAKYGAGSRFAQVDAGAVTATATFQPTIPEAGQYPVYVWFTKGANRARDARFTVYHSGGSTTIVVDQTAVGDHWLFLGEFHFAAGSAGRVVLVNRASDATKVVVADAVRFGGGVGPSGEPRWRESASSFLRHKGFTSAAGDVTIRPLYATWLAGGDTTRWRDDFLYFALHTNASTGAPTGLSAFSYSNGRTAAWDSDGPRHYPTSPSPLEAESDRLRDLVHARVLADVRATLEPAWTDRRTHRMNFGELREARNMPSMLIELGFHDAAPDAELLSDARFRDVAARAIYKGILRYWAPSAAVLPLAPDGLRLENLGGGQVRVGWDAVTDPLEPSAGATSFKLYTSVDGRGFDDGVVVAGTSTVLSGLAAGQALFVRVAARNAGGESLPSRVGGARVGAPDKRALLVDGFDRVYRHTEANIAGRFTYDHAVEHVFGLAQAAPDAAVDYAANEAVVRGRVGLAGYALVDWFLGREGSIDRTFDVTEQQLLEAYLGAGGTLLASGTELGWDLEARAGGARFLNEVLGVAYVSDDGGASAVRGLAGGPFASVSTLTLSDGARSYAAESCDVLAPRGAARAVLGYEVAGAPTAGVGTPLRTLVLGFPIEAVTDGARRAALLTSSVEFLSPGLRTVGAPTPTTPTTTPTTTPGSSTGPVASTSAPAATTTTLPVSVGGGGGGCSLGSRSTDATGASGGLGMAALGLLLVARRRAVASV